MANTERDYDFWDWHCWHKRFDGEVCAKPATWKGPQVASTPFTRAWRACDIHALPSDIPLERKALD